MTRRYDNIKMLFIKMFNNKIQLLNSAKKFTDRTKGIFQQIQIFIQVSRIISPHKSGENNIFLLITSNNFHEIDYNLIEITDSFN